MKAKTILLTLLLSASVIVDSLAQERMPLIYDVENTAADFPLPYLPSFSQLPAIQALPDSFEWADGRGRILNFSDWRYGRAEIGDQIQKYEIGDTPVQPDTIEASYSGAY